MITVLQNTQKIINCEINNKSINKYKLKSILDYIYHLIDNGTLIIKNTLLNIKTTKESNNGFKYYEKLGISIQGINSNKCIKEIFNQCKHNKIKLKLIIKLDNKDIISIVA